MKKSKKILALLMAAALLAGCCPATAYGAQWDASAVSGWTEEDLAVIAQARERLAKIVEERPVMALVYLAAQYPIRKEASLESDVLVSVPSGQTVWVQDAVMVCSQDGYEAWEYVNFHYRGKEYSGYMQRGNLACSDQRFLEWEAEYGMNPAAAALYDADGELTVSGSDAEEEIGQFPASYQEKLRQLKKEHPLWTFVPMQTGLDWNTVIANEIIGSKSLIYRTYGAWMKEGAYDDKGTWSFASEAALKYFMDPRNWLVENHIFQFELLTYNEKYHTEAALEQFLNQTFMNSGEDAPGTEMTYAHIIWAVGAEENRRVSPFHLAARIRQEQGDGTSPLISGTYPGYERYYNYFNVGATGKTNQEVIENGLKYAKEHNWEGAYYSILGGADVISANYIQKGQDTLYLQKFNVNPSAGAALYTHQYMQNISAPSNEGLITKNLYTGANSLDNTFVFKIPIYENMPENASPLPTASTNVVLQVPDGYRADEIYLDGIAYPSVSRNGMRIVTAADGNAKSAVVYQYNEKGVPTGMYVWTLAYQNNAYVATPQPDLTNLLGYHGFSIRITGKSGIRFKSSISKELRDRLTAPGGVNGYVLKEYGTLIMDNANRSIYPMIKGGNKVMAGLSYGINEKGGREDKIYETVNGRHHFTSVLVGLPAEYYRTEFAFRGYAVLEKGGVQTMVYGPVLAKSIYSLAEQIVTLGIYKAGSQEDAFLRKLITDAK